MNGVLIGKGQRHTGKKILHDDRDRDENDVSTNQGPLRVAGNHLMLRIGKKRYFPRAFLGNVTLKIS